MTTYVGIDLGNASISMSVWDGTSERPVGGPDGRASASSAVGFYLDSGRERRLESVFPVPQGWAADDSVIFQRLKSGLLAFKDADVEATVARAVFTYFRERLPSDTSPMLGLSVPFEYPRSLCQRLEEAARKAGFFECRCVTEALSALLAYMPAWLKDQRRRAAIQRGQSIWIMDAGSRGLTMTLLDVRGDERVTVRIAAAQRIVERPGTAENPADPLAALVKGAVASMSAAARTGLVRRDAPRSGQWDSGAWIVLCGGGQVLDAAVLALAATLTNADLCRDIPPVEVMASGSAVHAAQWNGAFALPMQVENRPVLGLRTGSGEDGTFTAISRPGDEPPFDFERAFEFPPPAEDEALELSFAAALPGGDCSTPIRTWVFERGSDGLRIPDSRVVLLQGQLHTWSGGRIALIAPESGAELTTETFELL